MGTQNLPKFDLNLVLEDNSSFDYHDGGVMLLPNAKRSGYILCIEKQTILDHVDNGLSVLFHEFTHLYDNESYLLNTPIVERSKILTYASECHASIIQLKCATGFEEQDKKSINSNTLICDRRRRIPFFTYLENYISEQCAFLNEWKKSGCLCFGYNTVFTHFMYTIGHICFARAYCNDKLPEYCDCSCYTMVLGPSASRIVDIMENNIMNDDTVIAVNDLIAEIPQYIADRELDLLKSKLKQ